MRKKSEALKTLKDITELKELIRKQKEGEAITKTVEVIEKTEDKIDKVGQNLTPGISEGLSEGLSEGFKEDLRKVDKHFEEVINAVVNDKLSITQIGVISFLEEGKNITEISKQLGISRQTIYTYLQTDKVRNAVVAIRKEIFETSLERLRSLNLRAVSILENGLSSYPEKYNIAKFIVNANSKLLEVEKKKIELIEEKKSQDKETGEEQKKTVSMSAEKTSKTMDK